MFDLRTLLLTFSLRTLWSFGTLGPAEGSLRPTFRDNLPNFQGSSSPGRTLSRNVGTELPIYAAQNPKR